MNEEFLEQHEVGMQDEYNDELLTEGLDEINEPIPTWFWYLCIGIILVFGALFIGMSLGDTRTITKTVNKIVYIPDTRLSDKIDVLTERLEMAERPHDDNYRLCKWTDFNCEEGVDYVEKEWHEKL